jgi:RHS repeat-associated protein
MSGKILFCMCGLLFGPSAVRAQSGSSAFVKQLMGALEERHNAAEEALATAFALMNDYHQKVMGADGAVYYSAPGTALGLPNIAYRDSILKDLKKPEFDFYLSEEDCDAQLPTLTYPFLTTTPGAELAANQRRDAAILAKTNEIAAANLEEFVPPTDLELEGSSDAYDPIKYHTAVWQDWVDARDSWMKGTKKAWDLHSYDRADYHSDPGQHPDLEARNGAYIQKERDKWEDLHERKLKNLASEKARASGPVEGFSQSSQVTAKNSANDAALQSWMSARSAWLEGERETAATQFKNDVDSYADKVEALFNSDDMKDAKEKFAYLSALSYESGFYPCDVKFKKALIEWTHGNPQGFDQELIALNEISKYIDRISSAYVHLGKVGSSNALNFLSFDRQLAFQPIGPVNPDNWAAQSLKIQERLRKMDTLRWPLLSRYFDTPMSVPSTSLSPERKSWNIGESLGGSSAFFEEKLSAGSVTKEFFAPTVSSTALWNKGIRTNIFKDEFISCAFAGGYGCDIAAIKGALTSGKMYMAEKVAYQGIWDLGNTAPAFDNLIHLREFTPVPVALGDNLVRFEHSVEEDDSPFTPDPGGSASDRILEEANHVLDSLNHRTTRRYQGNEANLGLPQNIPVSVDLELVDEEDDSRFSLKIAAETKANIEVSVPPTYKNLGGLSGQSMLLFKPQFTQIPDAPLDLAPVILPEPAFDLSGRLLTLVIPLPIAAPSPGATPKASIQLSDWNGNLRYASNTVGGRSHSPNDSLAERQYGFWGGMLLEGDRSDLTIESGPKPKLTGLIGSGGSNIELSTAQLPNLDANTVPISKITGSRGSVEFEWTGHYRFKVRYFSPGSASAYRTFEVSAGGALGSNLVEEIAYSDDKYLSNFEVISVNRVEGSQESLCMRATIVGTATETEESEGEFAKIEYFSGGLGQAEFTQYLINGIYDPVTSSQQLKIITRHASGDETEDQYASDDTVPPSEAMSGLLQTGHENWQMEYSEFSAAPMVDLSPFIPVSPNVGCDSAAFYSSGFPTSGGGAGWKHLPFYRYPKTRRLLGSGWGRNGELYTYDQDGSLVSHTYSSAGMVAEDRVARGANEIAVVSSLDGKILSSTPTSFPNGLTEAVQTVDGIASSVEYYSSSLGGGQRWMPRKVSGLGGETSYAYARPANGNLETTAVSTPAGTGNGVVTTKMVVNKFGALVSHNVEQGAGELLAVSATGHSTNPLQLATRSVITSSGVTRDTRTNFNGEGTIGSFNDGNGTVNSYQWDFLGRLRSGSLFGGRSVSATYGGFENSFQIGSDALSSEVDEYGRLQHFTSSAGAGLSLERLSGNRYRTAITAEGRSFEQQLLPDDTLASRSKGMGSPAKSADYSVVSVNGVQCIAIQTTLGSSGGSTAPSYVRYVDGRGRLRRITEPHPNGTGTVNTDYSYNMAARTVTITPPPPSKQISIQYAVGWSSATITQGGRVVHVSKESVDGVVKTLVEEGGREIYSRESSLETGTSVSKVSGRSGVTSIISADGNTASISGDYKSITSTFNRHGLVGITGSERGQNFRIDVARDSNTGRPNSVSVDPPGPRNSATAAIDPRGRVTTVNGTATDLALSYDYTGGGIAVTGNDSANQTSFSSAEDDEGNLKKLEASDKAKLAIAGKVLDGEVTVSAEGYLNQSVSYDFSPAGFVVGKSLSDGSGTSFVWNADGSLKETVRSDSWANGGAQYPFSLTRDPATGFPTGYQGGKSSLVLAPNSDGTTASAQYRMKDVNGLDQLHSVNYSSYFDDVPKEESYQGLLAGYVVKREFNEVTGDLRRVEVRKGGILVHAVDYTATGGGQVDAVTASAGKSFSATYGYPSSTVETLTAGAVVATRTAAADGTGNLTSMVTSAGGQSYSAVYGYNAAYRRNSLTVSLPNQPAMLWNYTFQNVTKGTGQLQAANLTQGGVVTTSNYNHDTSGNRAGSFPKGLNQYSVFQATGARTIAIEGRVQPGASVVVSQGGGATVSASVDVDGIFAASFPAPATGAAASSRNFEVVATLPGAGDGGSNAVAAEQRTIVLTPTVQNLTYGSHGALASDWRWNYKWNSEGRLEAMTSRSEATSAGLPNIWMRFAYDHLGRRIRKSVEYRSPKGEVERTISTRFVYDDWLLLAEEIDDSASPGAVQRYYTWGKDLSGSLGGGLGGTGGLVAVHQEGLSYVPVYDGNGNIIALTSASNGKRIAIWSRGPFGEPISSGGSTNLCPFGFATHYTDEESGLVYFGHRYYSPASGRWISREPLGEMESFNLYAYCHNDPVNKVDRLGLEEIHPNAPKNEEILAMIEALAAEKGYYYQRALARNSVSTNPMPAEFVTSGADGVRVSREQEILRGILSVREELGKNGYGTWTTGGVIERELGEGAALAYRPFFMPASGYMAPTEQWEDFTEIVGWGRTYFNVMTSLALGVPGAATRTGALAVNAERLAPAAVIPAAGREEIFQYVNAAANNAASLEINQATVMRALRQNGSREALATAALIKRGRVGLEFVPTAHADGRWGQFVTGTNRIQLFTPSIRSPQFAGGVVAHETKHFLQRLTPATYNRGHEFEAFTWQAAADKGFWLRTAEDIWRGIRSSPAYKMVPEP